MAGSYRGGARCCTDPGSQTPATVILTSRRRKKPGKFGPTWRSVAELVCEGRTERGGERTGPCSVSFKLLPAPGTLPSPSHNRPHLLKESSLSRGASDGSKGRQGATLSTGGRGRLGTGAGGWGEQDAAAAAAAARQGRRHNHASSCLAGGYREVTGPAAGWDTAGVELYFNLPEQ